MKKLIALILILVITNFVVVSNDDQPLSMKIAIENSNNPNPKNEKWEYVKDRLFDGETEKVYKHEGPILISLNRASKQDSLIVNEIIKELRTVIPNKTIAYFDDFIGISLDAAIRNGYNEKYKGIPFYDLVKSTTELTFGKDINFEKNLVFQQDVEYRLQNKMGSITRDVFGPLSENNYSPISISFNFDKKISLKERQKNIQYEL